MPIKITSSDNSHFKRWKSLLSSRGIKKQSQFLLSGSKVVKEQWQKDPLRFQEIIVCEGSDDLAELTAADSKPVSEIKSKIYELPGRLFSELDEFATESALLVGSLPEFRETDLKSPAQGLEILCALGDPANLGSLIRAAKAFDASRVILLKESAHPFLPKVSRAASGLNLQTEFLLGPSLYELSNVSELICLDLQGENIQQFSWPKNLRMLVGEEGQGIPASLKKNESSVFIPMNREVESLNAVSAISIALYSYRSAHPL